MIIKYGGWWLGASCETYEETYHSVEHDGKSFYCSGCEKNLNYNSKSEGHKFYVGHTWDTLFDSPILKEALTRWEKIKPNTYPVFHK
jgi:hypothetical protein